MFDLPTVGRVIGGATSSWGVARGEATMVLGESGQKSFGGDDSGPSSSCGPCDFSITGHHRQSLGGRGTLDQTDDVVVGLDSGPGESHVNARTFNLVGLLHPVAHEDGGLASIATACDQVREFRKVDARKIGRKDSNHVQHVVCVDKEWHAWNSKGSGLRGMLTQLEATTRGDVGRSRAGYSRSSGGSGSRVRDPDADDECQPSPRRP